MSLERKLARLRAQGRATVEVSPADAPGAHARTHAATPADDARDATTGAASPNANANQVADRRLEAGRGAAAGMPSSHAPFAEPGRQVPPRAFVARDRVSPEQSEGEVELDADELARSARIVRLRGLIEGFSSRMRSAERGAAAEARVEASPWDERIEPAASGHPAMPLSGRAVVEVARSAPLLVLSPRGVPPAPMAGIPASALPGERVETPFGRVRRSENVLQPEHCHGHTPVRGALTARAELIARLALDPELASVDLKGALFLDTETTGLAGGTGTVPFLIGYAWFEDESLFLHQLFLEELGEEAPMLELLRDHVERATCLVTYNGKSYDWPLLSSRFVMNRVAPPRPVPHVDLLHCARRVFRPRLGGARLVTMEEQVLGMRRERDIDGAEIPGLYWSYLRHKNGSAMARVVEHNANDLVALAALLGVLSDRYAALRVTDDPIDHLALARVAVRAKDPSRALDFARAASEGGGEVWITVEACLLAGELHKKRGEWAEARAALEEAIITAGTRADLAAPAHLELSKLFEHRLKALDKALRHARYTEAVEGPEDHGRRIARLERRIARHAALAAHPKRRAPAIARTD